MGIVNLLLDTTSGIESAIESIIDSMTDAVSEAITETAAETTAAQTVAETTAAQTIAETTAAQTTAAATTAAHTTAAQTVAETISKVTNAATETGEAVKGFFEAPPPAFTVTAIVVALVLLATTAVLAFCLIRATRRTKAPSGGSVHPAPEGAVRSVAVGKVHEQGAREYQQDCFAVTETSLMPARGVLGVVADGMGGLADGDKVSQAIVEAVLDGFMELQGPMTHEQALLSLASRAVSSVDRLLGPNGYKRCGSTLIMGYLRGNGFSFVSVGDSRICLFRGGELMQLNREHIYRNELALNAVNGEQTLASVYADKKGSGLTSFVGMGRLKHIDMPASPIIVHPGDKLMLMSDGIYNAMTSAELTGALMHPAAEAAEIIRTVISGKNYPGQDNYTGIIFECLAEEPPASVPAEAPARSHAQEAAKPDVPSTSGPDN